jgi:hypothetical protein
MASPMLGIASDRTKLISTKMKVTRAFYLAVNFLSAGRKSSSTVSLQGRIVSGVANRITVKIPKSEM